jgi:transcriptional regulator with AAA-type ATPase domain/tetratricopeptide (TPR) repeat protein
VPILSELIGESPAVVAVRQTVARLLQRVSNGQNLPPILLQGETGTGKGLIAKGIHRAGGRAAGPFVEVNCAAIPERLVEAELFGFERGAFTDARQGKPGLFQEANGGTIFLDEIALLPEEAQGKLLKVLEDRQVRRLGSTRTERVDAWVITASNQTLGDVVRGRRFREDLFHRLAVITILVPPLRDRGEDVLLLAEEFLARAAREYQLPAKRMAPSARKALLAYSWPGNVRELANAIERAALLSDRATVEAEDLQLPSPVSSAQVGPSPTVQVRTYETAARLEREPILAALEASEWNLSQAATRLGVARNTLRYRIDKLGLNRADTKPSSLSPRPRVPIPARHPDTKPSNVPDVAFDRQRRTVAAVRLVATFSSTASIAERGSILTEISERFHTFGGHVERIGVEGCLALFGLQPIEDAARRAASAALAVRQMAHRDDRPLAARATFRAALDVRTVVICRFGQHWEVEATARQELEASLDTLVSMTDSGAISVSPAAVPFLDRRFDLERDGFPEGALAIMRLKGAEGTRYTVAGRVTSFVGRHGELQLLRSAIDALTERRSGRLIEIVGEPGAGKSRLLSELRAALPADDPRWIESVCQPHGASTPFLPFVPMVRECLEIGADTSPAGVVAALGRAMPGDADETQTWPPLLALLGALVEPHPFTVLPAEERRRRMAAAVAELLSRQSRQRRVLLVVEDAHWIDRESQEVLDDLAERVEREALVVLVTRRPEAGDGAGAASRAFKLRLAPLTTAESLALLDDLLGRAASLQALKVWLADRTGGNPLFLEESVRALVEAGVLTGAAGAYVAHDARVADVVPATISAVLAARIQKLPARRQRVLQCAAVFGRSVTFAVLQRVLDLPTDTLRDEVRALRAAQLLHDTAETDGELAFSHALTQEIAYDSADALTRVDWHARAVAALEDAWRSQLGDMAETLADHAIRGHVWDRAVDYLRVAGAKAYDRGALADAVERYERALATTDRLPNGVDRARRAIDVRLDLHAPLMTLGRVKRIVELYPEAERLAREIHDGSRLGQVLQRMSQIAWLAGSYRVGVHHAQQALAVAEAVRDAPTRIGANYFLGQHRHALGEYAQAIPCFSYVVEGPDADLASRLIAVTTPFEVPAWSWLGLACALTGRFERAYGALRRGIERAEASQFLQAAVIAHTLEGVVFAYAGRAGERVRAMEETAAVCERIGFLIFLSSAYSSLGVVLARAGHFDAALGALERGVTLAEKSGIRSYQAHRYSWLAEGLWLAGRREEARRRAETALGMAASLEERGIETETLLVRGLIANGEGDHAGARQWLERALAGSLTTGARPTEAHCRLALAGTLERLGEHAEAARLLTAADAMFHDMGTTPWWPERYWRA